MYTLLSATNQMCLKFVRPTRRANPERQLEGHYLFYVD